MAINRLKSLSSKPLQLIQRFRNTVLLLLIIVLLTSIATAFVLTIFLIDQPNNPSVIPTPMPTLTPTPEPTDAPTPIPTPDPTYVPGEKNYSSYGNLYVTGIEVFGGDLEGNQIRWGHLYLGDSKNVSFFVRSKSNVPIKLSLSVTDWTPPAISTFLKLSWNYNQTEISPNKEIFLTLTLTTPLSQEFTSYLINNNVNSFNFNIHIYSTKN